MQFDVGGQQLVVLGGKGVQGIAQNSFGMGNGLVKRLNPQKRQDASGIADAQFAIINGSGAAIGHDAGGHIVALALATGGAVAVDAVHGDAGLRDIGIGQDQGVGGAIGGGRGGIILL